VFRRDDTHLQVGIDDSRVVVPDTPGVRKLLRELERGEGLGSVTPDAGIAFDRLDAAGFLVEGDQLRAAGGDRPGLTYAAFAANGPRAPALLAARAACRVSVHGPEPWHSVQAERLAAGGLSVASTDGHPNVTVVISAGEPPRSVSDELMRHDLPHLLVTLLPDGARVGPFVMPGRTACQRCIDAHLSEDDVRRPLVLEQLEHLTVPGPCDPVLSHAALAMAAREMATYAEGGRPATWSATLTLGPDLDLPLRAWSRHPHCGCSWG
jgi:hypothetical protein